MFRKGQDVYLIAEIGGNHEGSVFKARELVHMAADAGVDAIKFQVYTGESIVNEHVDPARKKHFDKFALTNDDYLSLAELCLEKNVHFLASIWNHKAIDLFQKFMPFVKIGSGDLTAYQFLRKISSYEKPILLSTGLSTIDEVKSAVRFISESNPKYEQDGMLSVLQCTSMYPIPDAEANLNVINTLKLEFPNMCIGYSDHTVGSYAAEIAVCMGAEILELHFTDCKESTIFRDHQVSFTQSDIIELRRNINKIKELQGCALKSPTKSEIESGHTQSFRRGVFMVEPVSKGKLIEERLLISLRPNIGIDARDFYNLIGKRAAIDIAAFQPLSYEMFE